MHLISIEYCRFVLVVKQRYITDMFFLPAWPMPLQSLVTCSGRIQRMSFRASGAVKQTIALPSHPSMLRELVYGRGWSAVGTGTALMVNHRSEK